MRYYVTAVISVEAIAAHPEDDMIVGQIFHFAGPTLPAKCLLCDGSAVSRTTYPGLFAAIGITWGMGDGLTTFNLPDLRGRAVIGAGTGPGLTARALASFGGEEEHTLAAGELAAHSHTVTDPGHTHSGAAASTDMVAGWAVAKSSGDISDGTIGTIASNNATSVTVDNNTPADGAHNNMQPWSCGLAVIYSGV